MARGRARWRGAGAASRPGKRAMVFPSAQVIAVSNDTETRAEPNASVVEGLAREAFKERLREGVAGGGGLLAAPDRVA